MRKRLGPRFIAKRLQDPRRVPRWGVYDTERASWPHDIVGGAQAGTVHVEQDHAVRETAEAEANRLNELLGGWA